MKNLFLALCLSSIALLSACDNNQSQTTSAKASAARVIPAEKLRPEFSLPDEQGKMHNIKEWDGKVLVVNFWATWCPPCRKEMPAFIELQEQYGKQGLQFIGVAIDDAEKVVDFMDTYGVNYPMLVGDIKAVDVSKAYGNRFGALPYTVIISREGEMVFIQRGELTKEQAEKQIKALL